MSYKLYRHVTITNSFDVTTKIKNFRKNDNKNKRRNVSGKQKKRT